MRPQGDATTVDRADFDLRDTVRMCTDDFECSARPWSPEAELHMRRETFVVPNDPRPLTKGDVRLAYVPELQLLFVLEGGHRRIFADTRASPRAEEEGEWFDLGKDRGDHERHRNSGFRSRRQENVSK
jgi:hypothetical protein